MRESKVNSKEGRIWAIDSNNFGLSINAFNFF